VSIALLATTGAAFPCPNRFKEAIKAVDMSVDPANAESWARKACGPIIALDARNSIPPPFTAQGGILGCEVIGI
jgi:hypothetical protein